MRAVGIIPARMGSSRFPGKPLAAIAGRPMLEHCHRGASASELLEEVVIATCDQEIVDWAATVGIRAVMTSDRHQRATDRVEEAMDQLGELDAVVLIQGDEPMVTGEMVDASLGPVLEGTAQVTNLMKRIDDPDDLANPNTIKVVADRQGRALYFSRSPIPSPSQGGFDALPAYRQVCVFGFTPDGLREFARLDPTPLEIAESIDMLRYLEHGRPVHFVETTVETAAVDVPEDIAIVERLLDVRA
jgi:3-deoxy-manno-octulosonate cytidylyltransferase (CMP-KDO synthetase)